MRLLITGSREMTPANYPQLKQAIETYYPDATEIWHGGAQGCDQLAERYAREKGLQSHTIRPDYGRHSGKLAPLRRNEELVRSTEATLAAHTGKLKTGTNHTAHYTIRYGNELTAVNLNTGKGTKVPPSESLSL